RGNSHVAIVRYGCGVQLDHDLVSKSRNWRRRNHNRFGCAPFRKRGNGGLVVRGQNFSASASDGDLSALALRFALEWLPLIALVLLIGLLWFFRNRGLRGGFVAAGYFVV